MDKFFLDDFGEILNPTQAGERIALEFFGPLNEKQMKELANVIDEYATNWGDAILEDPERW